MKNDVAEQNEIYTDNFYLNKNERDYLNKIKELSQENLNLKQKNNELERNDFYTKSILDTVPDIIYRLDTKGLIIYISRSIETYGYDQKELIGKSIFDLVHPEDLDKARHRLNERRTGDRSTRLLEIRFIRKDHTAFPIEVRSSNVIADPVLLISANGLYDEKSISKKKHYLGTQGIARDITERKKIENEKTELERQLRQAQKMEAIGTLAGGIAHDFNNIIFPIMGNAEMAMDDLEPDSQIYENLQQIMTSAERAKNLVQQILTFSRQHEYEKSILAIQPIIKETLKLLRATLPASINIKHDISKNTGMILADPTQIYQVLMNLCTNAFQAMQEKGGTLSVILKQVKEGPSKIALKKDENTYIQLSVSDTGHGIFPKDLEYIFTPYFTTKSEHEGTGLGLSVVHGIIKSMNGEIYVESQLDIGTTFTIYIPISEPITETNNIHQVKQTLQGGDETILIVDDEAPIVRMETRVLERLGYGVIARTSSVEALEAFRVKKNIIDLIITDLDMPNMSGLKFAEEVSKIKSDIPIILCTGFGDSYILQNNLNAVSIAACLKKPIVMGDMARCIRQVLNGNIDEIVKSPTSALDCIL